MPRGIYPRNQARSGPTDDFGPPGPVKRRKRRKARNAKPSLNEIMNNLEDEAIPPKIVFSCNKCEGEIPMYPVSFCPWCGVKFNG